MTPRRDEGSRLDEVARKALLRRSAAIGALAMLPATFLASCGGDASAFEATTTTVVTSATSATDSTDATTTTTLLDSTTTAASGAVVPSTSELVIDFTYAASSSGGMVKNPYVAVWIEDADGNLVAPVSLWVNSSSKGLQYVHELSRWYSVDGSADTVETVSSATRTPGDYSVVWDGTDLDGNPVAEGEYYICIEAAREHGPYSLIRESITIDGSDFQLSLAADGELSDAAIAFSA